VNDLSQVSLGSGLETSDRTQLLFVSFSESETAFLGRTAKILAETGKWQCSFLLLHSLAENSPIAAEFDALGISIFCSSEESFYDAYHRSETESRQEFVAKIGSNSAIEKFHERLHLCCRDLKASKSLHYRLLALLLEVALFIPWVLRYGIIPSYRFSGQLCASPLTHKRVAGMTLKAVFIIPWVFRYGFSHAMRRVFQELKKWLRVLHPRVYGGLRRITLACWTFWDNIPVISEHDLKIRTAREEKRLRKYIDGVTCFLTERGSDTLILAKDSAYYSTIVFVQAARNLGVPSVVIPYDRADLETLANDRLGHPNHVVRSHEAREIAKQFPSWVYIYENQALLLVAPATVYAIEQLNLAPSNPWGYNNSRCDRIFLETEEDRQLFLKSGAPPNQLVVVGAPYMDSLDEILCQRNRMRAQLCTTFGFAPDKPFVVASVSPNKVSQRSADLEFKSYRTLIDKWSSALVRYLDCNLIYSLHPLTDHADVVFIEKKGGKILYLPLEELIAAADLYVVDCSSTARWARYAGVDVIDYDFYKYNLWFNSKIEGVCHVTAYDDFISELIKANEKLIKPEHCTANAARQAKVSFKDNLSLELNNLFMTSTLNPLK
jgi:hypothetical protein